MTNATRDATLRNGAREMAKELREAVNGFTGYSLTHHSVGSRLMDAAGFAANALEQMAGRIAELEEENDRLQTEVAADIAALRSEIDSERVEGWAREVSNSRDDERGDRVFFVSTDDRGGKPATLLIRREPVPPAKDTE